MLIVYLRQYRAILYDLLDEQVWVHPWSSAMPTDTSTLLLRSERVKLIYREETEVTPTLIKFTGTELERPEFPNCHSIAQLLLDKDNYLELAVLQENIRQAPTELHALHLLRELVHRPLFD